MTNEATRGSVQQAAFWQAYARHRYAILFYILLFMLVALPIADTLGLPPIALKLLVAGCLLAAVMPNATRGSRYTFLAAIRC